MITNKGFAWFGVGTFFIGLIFSVIQIFREQKYVEDGCKKTFEKGFSGAIARVNSNHSIITVELDHKRKYIFMQETESYLKQDAMKFIEFGDSISKRAFSDIIFIKHHNHVDSIIINRPE